MTPATALLLVVLLPLLTACTQLSGTPSPTALPPTTPSPAQLDIIELPELQSYTQAALNGDPNIAWKTNSESPLPVGSDPARNAVQTTIQSEAARLSRVDYAALSLPAFVTVTRSLKLTPQDFLVTELRLDSTGSKSDEPLWAIYSWKGPDFPQLPGRDQVFRWVQVYAIYDLKQYTVTRLIGTIQGEAHE
jgi:hypothetical protein